MVFNLENLIILDVMINFVLFGCYIKINWFCGDLDGKENSNGDFFKLDDFYL